MYVCILGCDSNFSLKDYNPHHPTKLIDYFLSQLVISHHSVRNTLFGRYLKCLRPHQRSSDQHDLPKA